MLEVDVLDAQLQAFIDAQAATVEQRDDQVVAAIELLQYQFDFIRCEHGRQTALLACQLEAKIANLQLEVFLVKEDQRVKRRLLRVDADVPVDRQMGQEAGDFAWRDVCRMLSVGESNVAADPAEV